MQQVDFSNYKFRASAVKNLMTQPKSKAAREAGELSQTTKSFLEEIYIEEQFGRKKPISSGPMEKGTIVESDSLDLVASVHDVKYFKNKERFENEFVAGTPDVVVEGDRIIDVKSSWDLWTFIKVNEKQATKDYYHQVLVYMWLNNLKKGSLNYVLVNTPDHIMEGESAKLAWRLGQEMAEEITRKNHTFDDIEPSKRLKEYHFEYNEEVVEEIKSKVIRSRQFLQEMSL
jgi:hypothetical protein